MHAAHRRQAHLPATALPGGGSAPRELRDLLLFPTHPRDVSDGAGRGRDRPRVRSEHPPPAPRELRDGATGARAAARARHAVCGRAVHRLPVVLHRHGSGVPSWQPRRRGARLRGRDELEVPGAGVLKLHSLSAARAHAARGRHQAGSGVRAHQAHGRRAAGLRDGHGGCQCRGAHGRWARQLPRRGGDAQALGGLQAQADASPRCQGESTSSGRRKAPRHCDEDERGWQGRRLDNQPDA
mmetsp:Transcript_12506/g.37586  ORF Transcript_12506/g.37586 Transcript_12506/m.37586 type:complete len:240 (-) Transcript_12506:2371-3090(-)